MAQGMRLYPDDGPTQDCEIAALGRALSDATPFLGAILVTEAAEALHMCLPNWLKLNEEDR
jgi:hypothetical protein